MTLVAALIFMEYFNLNTCIMAINIQKERWRSSMPDSKRHRERECPTQSVFNPSRQAG